jgi:PAS domain S-box-containing protein
LESIGQSAGNQRTVSRGIPGRELIPPSMPSQSEPLKPPSDNAFRVMLETALDAVVIMRSDGTVADWNASAEEIFGWSRHEVVGRPMAEFIIPAPHRDGHRRGLETYMKTGVGPLLRKRIEITALRKMGEEFPVELTITPLRDGDDVLFIGSVRDISDRKEAERLLKRTVLTAELVYRITAFAAESSSFEDMLRASLAAVQELTGWPLGHVYLPGEGEPLELAPSGIWHPQETDRFAKFRDITNNTRFSPGVGLPGEIWQSGEPTWMTDVATNPNFPRARVPGGVGIKSAFGFPIKSRGRIIAILEFFSDISAEVDPDVLLMVRSIGLQVGRVFERRRAEEVLLEHAKVLEVINQELSHRAKNVLAMVTGIAAQTARGADSIAAFNEKFLARLSALGRAQSLLVSPDVETAPLARLVQEMLAPYADINGGKVKADGPPLALPPKHALSLGMILHELVTNAVKYGALSVPQGRISIRWRMAQGVPPRVYFSWREQGVPGVTPPSRRGFGSKLVEASATHELGGKVGIEYGPDGVSYVLDFPLVR